MSWGSRLNWETEGTSQVARGVQKQSATETMRSLQAVSGEINACLGVIVKNVQSGWLGLNAVPQLIGRFTEAVQQSIHHILNQEDVIDECLWVIQEQQVVIQEQHITIQEYAEVIETQQAEALRVERMNKEDEEIREWLDHILEGLDGKDTIMDAILHIDQALRSNFPQLEARIVLTPQINKNGNIVQNPIVQMLADMIDMMHVGKKARVKDEEERRQRGGESEEVRHMREQKEAIEDHAWDRIWQLIALLPVVVTKDVHYHELPSDMNVLDEIDRLAIMRESDHILTADELANLHPNIFWTPWIACVHDIRWIGKMVLLSDDTESRYPERHVAMFRKMLNAFSKDLRFIGATEENKKDPLTWLPLRRIFHEQAEEMLETARRNGAKVVFAMVDGDKFKSINDRFGHPAWDLVIKTLAQTIMNKLSMSDLKVRWWGEEFGILMFAASSRDATKVLQRVAREFSKIKFQVDETGKPSVLGNGVLLKEGAQVFGMTLTIGVSDPAGSLDDMIKQADKRLYGGKETGRERIVYGDGMTDALEYLQKTENHW